MEKYTVDSVRDGRVTLLLRRDESVKIVLPQAQLPGVQESDIISAAISQGRVEDFKIEKAETQAVKVKIQAKLDKLKNRPGN